MSQTTAPLPSRSLSEPLYISPLAQYLDRFNPKSPRTAVIESVPDPESSVSDDPKENSMKTEALSKRIAIIGGGISGIAAYWALRNTVHNVDLFEQTNDLGGLTQPIRAGTGLNTVHVNKGFINFFSGASPNLINFIRCLKISCIKTLCNFSVKKVNSNVYFDMSFNSVRAVASHLHDWLRLDAWRLYVDIWRFHYFCRDLLRRRAEGENHFQPLVGSRLAIRDTVGNYLNEHRYSRIFLENYLLPMAQVVWNVQSEQDLRDLPVQHFVNFFWSSGFLTWPQTAWIIKPDDKAERKIKKRIRTSFKNRKTIHLRSKITSVEVIRDKDSSKLSVTALGAGHLLYDYVIFAVPPEEALRLLSTGASQEERQILGAFETTKTDTWLHSDSSFVSTGKTSATRRVDIYYSAVLGLAMDCTRMAFEAPFGSQ
ncbi:predicted protein [Uncinocarpus reesii 1704]|uniref:Amine oxidase domain-containing protein n=1 Tax=Uncinocarpus reesii (strain UAMH 1704) TaxID=336963 RepID=C4JRN2_UNCRE|nr:uncharacterized protein UREG_05121 [Uncinocarpus reesii 1704]EEP80279.1 predicted protein [Uncinocarpus reesii 1704]